MAKKEVKKTTTKTKKTTSKKVTKKEVKKQFPFRIVLTSLLVFVSLICLVSLFVIIFKINILPNKILLPIIIGGSIIFIALSLIELFSKKLYLVIPSTLLLILLSIGSVITFGYFDTTYKFIKNTVAKEDMLNYSVLVLNDSDYKELQDLKDKKITYLKDDYSSDIKKILSTSIDYEEVLIEQLYNAYDSLKSDNTNAIVLEKGFISLANEEIEGFKDNTREIYSFNVEVKKDAKTAEKKVVKPAEPFVLYISGIDQYGNVNSVRGRSDVNQLMVINPKTHKVLLVNTPRDYYVQLAGTTGLRDKLTHAGVYGIEKSIDTLEEVYQIDINHYVRINFDTLIKTVDIIGGIDVESDLDFIATHGKFHVVKGWNHFNGIQALGYSRERYAYIDGDHHRGRNQQQVIEAIINKITSDKSIITKYNSILNSMDGSFQTDMDMNFITSCIKYQLDTMAKWDVETIQATGYASWNYTYSMGYNYYLWVMEPDWDSVAAARTKIQETLAE